MKTTGDIMKKTLFLICMMLALTLTACAANEGGQTAPSASESQAAALSGKLVGQGASSQQVAIQTWTAGFQQANLPVRIGGQPVGQRTASRTGAHNNRVVHNRVVHAPVLCRRRAG